MGGKHKSKTNGLGKAIIRARFKGAQPKDKDRTLHTIDTDDGPSWTKLKSITQQNDLEEFLHLASLADKEFTAERRNVEIISSDHPSTPFVLSETQERQLQQHHETLKHHLRIPRRPNWNPKMSINEMKTLEKSSFLDWRRQLAEFVTKEEVLITPFEKNLEIWKQLWRVLERSDCILQIVDARNPLFFKCDDLETYAKEIHSSIPVILLVNKSDLLTPLQRKQWAEYFNLHQIHFIFFSALESHHEEEKEKKEKQSQDLDLDLDSNLDTDTEGYEEEYEEGEEDIHDDDDINEENEEYNDRAEDENVEKEESEEQYKKEKVQTEEPHSPIPLNENNCENDPSRIYHPQELYDYLIHLNLTPKKPDPHYPDRITVGLVGYPNVGKSSTINALLGMKKVQVSQTPGKTKKLQTLPLSSDILLCDCPGLVFPHLASTQADMVCNGILPIDELREFMGPAELIARRVPKTLLEHMFSFRIHVAKETVTGVDLCKSFAMARGFVRGSQGNPDETRASRTLLKEYVQGKIPYNHPPPGIDATLFNEELHALYLKKYPKPPPMSLQPPKHQRITGTFEHQLDAEFFGSGSKGVAHVKGKYKVAGYTRMGMGAVPVGLTMSTEKKHRHRKKNTKVRVPVKEYFEN